MRLEVYMTERDELPLLEFVRSTGGQVIHIFSPCWPPIPLAAPPTCSGEDECLAIWYVDVLSENEMRLPDCLPELGPHGCYVAWSLPLITFQRQWYWKKQTTILEVEKDFRAFRPNRDEDAEFTSAEVSDFERCLTLLHERAAAIRSWCTAHLRKGFIGEDAWQQSEELRYYGG